MERLLAAGAVGCNFEDTDHHGDGPLVDAERQAERIRAIKDAGDIVVNARVDAREVDEMIRRGRLYREAEVLWQR